MPRLIFQCCFRRPTGFELDAEFTAGDGVTALVGPSGSGKTTVLELIAGLLTPHSGRIELAGRVLFDKAARTNLPPEQRSLGIVFQDYLLFPHLTVEENLRYGARRRPNQTLDFDHLVEVLELGPFLKRPPRTLSGGQQQRTALGRAILFRPELLLLDEPVSALDADLKESVLTYLARVVAEYQIATLLISHERTSVAKLTENVVSLVAGRIVTRNV